MSSSLTFKKYDHIGLDINIFIYFFQRHPEFGPLSKSILNQLFLDKLSIVTSIISLIELLSFTVSEKQVEQLEQSFLSISNLDLIPVDQKVSLLAAKIRRKYGFKLADSIQLATAKLNRAQAFITNDQRLKKFKELKIILLDEIS